MKEIMAEQLAEKLAQYEEVNLIDVREDHEIATGKIPEAIHIPLGSFENELGKLNKGASYMIICAAGGRSAMACQIMEQHGYEACNVIDGMAAWTGDIE